MAYDAGNNSDTAFTKTLRLFFVIFLGIGLVLGGALFSFYNYQNKGFVRDLLTREKYSVELRSSVVEDSLNSVASDLDFLSSLDVVDRFVNSGDPELLRAMTEDFLRFVKTKGLYDQARVVSADGMELLRINYNGGLPAIVSSKLLQSKAKRYYFTDTMLLGKGEVYISPMDLNIENGKVETPYKPMIRLGTPLYDKDGRPKGAILLNYRADNLLGLLRRTGRATEGQTMLLNSDGYWLLAPDSEDQWGFMIPDKKNVSFAQRYPELWIELRANDSGQAVTGNKVFTFATVYPLNSRFHSSSGSKTAYDQSASSLMPDEYFWKLVSYIPNSAQQGYSKALLFKIFLLGAAFFLLTGAIAWLGAYAIVRRKLNSARIVELAQHDSLTGLPNRHLFFDRFAHAFEHAQRYEYSFALLSIHVDDFKLINDAQGADAGDDVLVQLASRIEEQCRKSDTVARIGGDEFGIILSHVQGRAACEAVVEKMREAMVPPFIVGLDDETVSVSMGMCIYPDDTSDRETMLALVDNALHKAKAEGRGQICSDPK